MENRLVSNWGRIKTWLHIFTLLIYRLCRVVVVQSLKSCLTLWESMDCSTPGFPVLHHLPEFAQAHVHWFGDAIQHLILCYSPSPAFSLSQHQGLFFQSSGGQSTGASASASVLPMNIQGWFPLGLTGLIFLQSKGLSGVFSSNTVWRHQFFSAQSFLLSSSHIHTWLLEKP